MKTIHRHLPTLFGFFLWFLIGNALAQNPSQIDVLNTDDGLLFRDVSNIAQDSKGLMYFGTTQGLNRYDGKNFKAYTSNTKNPFYIKEDFIKANMVYEPTKNALWFMANDELFQLRLTEDSIINYTKQHNLKDRVLDVFKTKDNAIWVVTDDFWEVQKDSSKLYLQKFENNAFQVIATVNRYKRVFNHVAIDADGFIWWTTTRGTNKYSLKGELLEHIKLDTHNWSGDAIHYVPSFFDSNNTHYYFPNSSGGIAIFDSKTETYKTILKTDDVFRRAIEDQNNNIWFSSDSSVYKMDSKGSFTNYSEILKNAFDFSVISSLYVDHTGLLWGSTDNGLFKIKTEEQLFRTLFKSEKEGWGRSMRGIFEASEGRIFSLCENQHKLWYATKTGITDTLPLKDALGKPVSLLYDANFLVTDETKTKAYTTANGLSEINLKTGLTTTYDTFKSHNNVHGPNGLLRLDDGKLLFGFTFEHLTVFDTKSKKSQPIFSSNALDSNIRGIRVFEKSRDPDQVWLGTRNDGVIKIDLKGEIITSYNQSTIPAFGNYQVLSLLEDDDGSLWVGTYGGGLRHISGDGKLLAYYTTDSGLPNNNVVGVIKTRRNTLLISTYNGLSVMDIATGDFQNFYTENGLSHNEFNFSSFFKGSDGLFYFGGMNGVNVFVPNQLQEAIAPPPVEFLGVAGYNSKTKDYFETDYSQTEFSRLELSPYDQYFEVSWMLPTYFQNNKNTFSTQLEGFEDRWFYQSNSTSIRYNQLPAGDYILKVKGTDFNGNQSGSVLSIPITVKQIFYKKWWFIGLVIMTLIVLVYVLFRYRLRQVLALERLRTKISSDLHDDVGSLLSGLAMQTELLEENANENDKKRLNKIASISRSAVSQMRDLVWSIDSRRETIADLIERMRELAEELLLPKDIAYTLDCNNIQNLNKKLPAQTKQHIFLIYKEAINNILKHSDGDLVAIKLGNSSKGCQLIIKDNGSEKDVYKSSGLGLSNMAMRAEKLRASLKFESENGFGIYLSLPFNI
ncbi:hypothetical protein MTsPCn9_05010 [Croceitalea sp. MTPC9]|uniref:ligand-binding sensor domain-containing protein n=1 Tax=unclassified Croceitalea TaxID=2632280 RepID=UPI002B39EF07|nr:hypothetical protein MTsPCn6_03700 [Croceitalea sp. MTPC6]GMN15565.1 hypothetical protein MTsPCn9_05010 [Croceitalea sp. MTPC9]